jgi:two-component system sensor histidine kinase SenX3
MWFWLGVVAVAASFALGWFLSNRQRAVPLRQSQPVELDRPAVNDVLETLDLGIAVSGRDGVGEFRNSAAKAMAGTHAGVLLDDAIARHLGRGLVGIRSEEVIELHGPPRVAFVVRSSPLPGGGSVSFLEDISERRRIDQVRTDFVANVSHELKTPIGALSVLAETLQGESDPATVDRLAGRMLAEAGRASNTIDDLMELSRIELGGDSIVERVIVADLVQSAIERVRELAALRGITISAPEPDAGGGLRTPSLVVDGDRRQLVSAVGNLVENAVKYSQKGGTVQVRARVDATAVEVMVADQGIGIPRRDLDRVFERFYRVDRARSRETGGTGLGLAIVRHVASNHGGEVLVSSQEGEGSTFVLRLPATLVVADGAAASTVVGPEQEQHE